MASERTISSSATVGAPQKEVWEFLCDTQRYAEWVDGTLKVTRTDGPAQLGTTYRAQSHRGPLEGEDSLEGERVRAATAPGSRRRGCSDDGGARGGPQA